MSRLNINKLNTRIKKIISEEEAFLDVTPIPWAEDVLQGERKIVVSNIDKDYENKCVKLEIL